MLLYYTVSYRRGTLLFYLFLRLPTYLYVSPVQMDVRRMGKSTEDHLFNRHFPDEILSLVKLIKVT